MVGKHLRGNSKYRRLKILAKMLDGRYSRDHQHVGRPLEKPSESDLNGHGTRCAAAVKLTLQLYTHAVSRDCMVAAGKMLTAILGHAPDKNGRELILNCLSNSVRMELNRRRQLTSDKRALVDSQGLHSLRMRSAFDKIVRVRHFSPNLCPIWVL